MTRRHRRQRQDSNKILDSPIPRHERGRRKNDDHDKASHTPGHAALEALDDFGDLLEEVGVLGFLARTAPLHVDREHV